jgi:transcriptional regulator with XRE-family HTH domain
VNDVQLGRLVRALRHRRRWRQQDLADRAGVGRTVIVDLEAGRLGGMRLDTQRRVAAALGFNVEVTPRGLGAEADRVLDQGHAVLLGAAAKWLTALGWTSIAEVSYSEGGERGSIDLPARHASTETLLVIEIKTELASVEATIRKLDEKVRLAPTIATARFGWTAKAIGRLLVFPDERSERRRVAAHGAVLDGAFPVRSYAARRWCRSSLGPMAAQIFLPEVSGRGLPRTGGRMARVRPQVRTNVATRRTNSEKGPH